MASDYSDYKSYRLGDRTASDSRVYATTVKVNVSFTFI